ncbi:serine/arginine-rich SC35-like splicing factor SCL30 [Phragmites australis]|uniref:serine/arginine-rich SC35-like splicing factor SCL30 n=1 Tax=Phragmites australis TaxID=29695 RepID=UPI002D78552D|nr:serine/arginine-rich SC35-like splicing factor SCL30 [Phragmites australis]XP_062197550.1 serine/arginine-rich SC35-like splicing factor SCL30 [Phragmites australis]XP_062197551.1 serine/arginine-rich SC35-like splicing factor SCL30 [Phragmites australis]
MGRYSPAFHSPPRRGHGGRGRSPPRRGYGGGGGGRGGRGDQGSVSLLVRNIPLRCRPEDLRAPFERFGPVRDVYLPRDYHTGEPRGFGFVEFVDAYDASEAQYHMNRQMFAGREITVVLAADTRKRPEEMRRRTKPRGYSDHEGRRSSRHGRSRSRSYSRSRSPRPRGRARSRSYSPAPKRRDDYSASPRAKEEHRRSPRQTKEHDGDKKRRSYTPDDRSDRRGGDNGHAERSPAAEDEEPRRRRRASTESPPGSRSRSASPTHSSR